MFSLDPQYLFFCPVKYFPGHQRERKWTISVSSEADLSGLAEASGVACPPCPQPSPLSILVLVAGVGLEPRDFQCAYHGKRRRFRSPDQPQCLRDC